MHDDLTSLAPRLDFSRREFVVTSLAAGFALAAQPVSRPDDHAPTPTAWKPAR